MKKILFLVVVVACVLNVTAVLQAMEERVVAWEKMRPWVQGMNEYKLQGFNRGMQDYDPNHFDNFESGLVPIAPKLPLAEGAELWGRGPVEPINNNGRARVPGQRFWRPSSH